MTTKQRPPAQRLAHDRRALAGTLMALLAGTLLAACGRKGDLEPPPKPQGSDKGTPQ